MPEEPKLIRKLEDLDGYEDMKYKIRIVTGTNDLRVSCLNDDPYTAVLNIDIEIFDLKIIVSMLNLIGLNFKYANMPKFSEADILFAKAYTLIGFGEWWVARDNDEHLYIYDDIPKKIFNEWIPKCEYKNIDEKFFNNLTFDSDPIQLKDIAESEVEK